MEALDDLSEDQKIEGEQKLESVITDASADKGKGGESTGEEIKDVLSSAEETQIGEDPQIDLENLLGG